MPVGSRPPDDRQTRRLRRNLRVLTLRELLTGLRWNVLEVILQPFVLQLGGSVALVGLLETIGGYRGIVPTLVQPLGGWVADRAGRKGVAVVANLVAVGGLALLALAGWAGNASLLVPAIALFGLSALGRPAGEALVGESARGRRVGYAYGQVSFAWAVAGVLVSLGSGLLAERLGFAPVLAITAAIEMAGVLLLVFWVRETLQARRPARLAPVALRRLARGLLVPPAGLRMLYLAVVVDVFSYGLASQLIFGFLADRFGFTPTQFGIMNTVFSLAWAAAQLPAGRWVDRGRAREMLVLSEVLNAAAIGLWLVSSEFVAFVASMAVLGLVSALWTPAILSWVYERVPTARRAEELGRLSALPGLFGFPAPYLGGLLYDRLGFAVPVALNLAGALLAGALLAWGLRRGGGEGDQNADGS